jgi:glycosyltransferase involved in cell wall biosynthesis
MNVLWIVSVWPEPQSSAAGVRTMQLIDSCVRAGYQIEISSPCQPNKYQEALNLYGYKTHRYEPNDSRFDDYVKQYNPDIVFFDRFMLEEQFGWRVREQCPAAARVVDTIDLHSLRRVRQRHVESGRDARELVEEDLQGEDFLREIATIYRSDLSLIISSYEIELLKERFGISGLLIEKCSYSSPRQEVLRDFDERQHFVMIGNFHHAPNADSARILKKELWKKIQSHLKECGVNGVELHLYGAYPTHEILGLEDPASGLLVKGWAEDAREVLSRYRVNLAPLRYGAGIKGKIVEGWAVGTPCVGTTLAAEGMHDGLPFGGSVEDDWDQFARQAAILYLQSAVWSDMQTKGADVVTRVYNPEENHKQFIAAIESLVEDLQARRNANFVGSMLWHQQHRSTEYFSRWIEVKNKLREAQKAG